MGLSAREARAAAAARAEIPLLAGGRGGHYLDWAATAPMPRAVIAATRAYDKQTRGNVGRGVHKMAEAATAAFESARRAVADFLRVDAAEIVFTANATASLNIVAYGIGETRARGDSIWLCAADHHSNILPWQEAARRRGLLLDFLPLDENARVDCAALEKKAAREKPPAVIAVGAVSNVTGARVDLSALAKIARDCGARLIVDGAQAAARGAPDLRGIDAFAFSGHKCGAPTGVGVLWARRDLLEAMPPLLSGGGMAGEVETTHSGFVAPPHKFEAGTPPITQAVGLEAALRRRDGGDFEAATAAADSLAARARAELSQIEGARVLGHAAPGDAPIVSFCLDGAHPHDISQILAGREVATRGGHHCARLLMRFFGIDGCVRASVGPGNDDSDIDALVAGVRRAAHILSPR